MITKEQLAKLREGRIRSLPKKIMREKAKKEKQDAHNA